jgi:ribosomal protein S18 acetylase RimI-like enzyme
MNIFRIRKMTARDSAAVLAFWQTIRGIGLDDDCDTPSGLRRYLKRNPGSSFLAFDKDTLVGAVLSGHDGRRGYLHHLAVAASHRKSGIGKALVARCLQALAKQHIPKCNIFLFRGNAVGRAFWQRTGWKSRGDLSLLQKTTESGSRAATSACCRRQRNDVC